jgi:hypothetical protein
MLHEEVIGFAKQDLEASTLGQCEQAVKYVCV